MKATNKDGHEWIGEIENDGGVIWWMYEGENDMPYQSREVPAYRIHLNNARLVLVGKTMAIAPKL